MIAAEDRKKKEIRGALCFRTAFIVSLLCAVIYASIASWCLERGRPNGDEGFYALAAKLAWAGKVPYRDFGYTQAPLLPYIQGAAMRVVGFGVREQRWINIGWTTATTFFVTLALCSFGLPGWFVFGATLLWIGSLPIVYFCTVGKTYALAQLFLTGCGLGLFFPWSSHRKLIWVAINGVLAVGCRLTVGPAVATLWVGLIIIERPRISWTVAIIVPGILALVFLLPFVLASPANALFWTLDFHSKVKIVPRLPAAIANTLLFCPGLIAFATYLAAKYRNHFWSRPAAWCLAAALSGILFNVLLNGVYEEYTTPFWPLALAGTAGLIKCGTPILFGPTFRALLTASIGCTLGASIYSWPNYDEPGYLDSIDEAATFLRNHTSKDSTILPSMPEIPLQADRTIIEGFELGKFGVTAEMSPELAKSRNLIDFQSLTMMIAEQKPSAIVLSPYSSWSFGWSVPSIHSINSKSYILFLTVLNAAYADSYRDGFFVIYLPRAVVTAPSSMTNRRMP